MAGIGFELKRLFRRKGLFATMRAYGYAGIVCTGPMLLGVLLQVGILVLCGLWGVGRANQDLLVCMVTYTLLASLTLTSFFSMPVTRFLADMLFAEREDEILPSFWGSNAIMLVAGTVLYGVFFAVLGGHAAAGAAVPVALQHHDRQLERHELSHGHQRLSWHSVQLCGRHWRGVPVRPGSADVGTAAGRGPVGVNRPRLRRHACLGCGTAVPVFSTE